MALRPVRELFDRIADKTEVPDDFRVACWIWRGAYSLKRRGARPVIREGRRGTSMRLVTRIVCEWVNGPPPTPEHEAGHTCPDGENAQCISPYHLQWMTRVENERWKKRCA